ncbi:hypothetical protein ACFLZZ_01105 [Nanoarchaeota archaeon]
MKVWLILLIILIGVFVLIPDFGKNVINSEPIEKVKQFFEGASLTGCPQFDVDMNGGKIEKLKRIELLEFAIVGLPTGQSELDELERLKKELEDGKFSLNINGLSYDGWKLYSSDGASATCRKGKYEGENINHYYCGGFSKTPVLGYYIDAYIVKTPISESGDVGKTTKHIIWNEYDENHEFVRTKCLGDPDKFEEEQIKGILGDFGEYLYEWG